LFIALNFNFVANFANMCHPYLLNDKYVLVE
jgi:hypothetical protein